MRASLACLAALLLLAACDSGSPDADQQIVVSALLEAGNPMPDVSVSRTVPLGEVYDPATAAVRDAEVVVVALDTPPGAGAPTTRFAFNPETSRYRPVGSRTTVAPGVRYRLEVRADGRALSAETVVPPAFRIVDPLPESAVYQVPTTGPQLRITTSSVAGRQAVFIVRAQALFPDEFVEVRDGTETRYRSRNLPGRFSLVPVYRDVFFGCDAEPGGGLICDRDPSGADAGSSRIINESSYITLGDGTARVNLPWFAFGFYGPTEVSLVALDDAYKAFLEGTDNQSGGGTLSPGEIPNIESNVSGGIGVFGSFARVTARVTVLEQ